MTKKEMAGSEQERITLCECVFSLCVAFLEWAAKKLDPVWPAGMDYVKVNVILFCILLPVILVGSLALNIALLSR